MLQHSRCIININSQPYHFCHFFFLPVHTGISLAHGYFIAEVPDKGSTILLVVFYKWGGEGLFFFIVIMMKKLLALTMREQGQECQMSWNRWYSLDDKKLSYIPPTFSMSSSVYANGPEKGRKASKRIKISLLSINKSLFIFQNSLCYFYFSLYLLMMESLPSLRTSAYDETW